MRTFFALVGFILTMASAQAAHTQAQLVLADDVARPGETVLVGVHLKMEPGWHTYWKNPGEAGMATKIVWHLPQGVTAGDIQWPLREKLPPAEVTTYGYERSDVAGPVETGGGCEAGPPGFKRKSFLVGMQGTVPPRGHDGADDVERRRRNEGFGWGCFA